MDINCVHACFYQTDGKCTLNELPAYSAQTIYTANDIDCPYYAERW